MKRLLSILLIAVMLISLSGCTIFPSVLLKIKTDKVTGMYLERIEDGESVKFEADNANIQKFIAKMQQVLYLKGEDCQGTEGHVFYIELTTTDGLHQIYVNEDGSVCYNGVHYAVDFSSETALSLNKLSRWIDEANTVVTEEAPEVTEETETEEIIETEEMTPQELADSIVTINSKSELLNVNGTSYFTAEADILNESSVIFASTGETGIIKIYYKAPAGTDMQCVYQSYELSNEKMLYVNAYIQGSSPICIALNLETNKATSLSSEASSNLVAFDDPVVSIMQYGWIVTDTAVVPINLETGEADIENGYSIEKDDVLNVINNHFFTGNMEGYDKKITTVEALTDNYLTITVTESSTDGNPDIVNTFEFDCVNHTFEQI